MMLTAIAEIAGVFVLALVVVFGVVLFVESLTSGGD